MLKNRQITFSICRESIFQKYLSKFDLKFIIYQLRSFTGNIFKMVNKNGV